MIVLAVAYVALGGAYTALFLWPRWLISRQERIKNAYEQWCKNRVELGEPVDSKELFFDSYHYREFKAANNKERLATWTMMWVFSLVWDATHKPLIWLYENIYHSFGRLFDRVGRKTSSKILGK